MLKTTYLPAVIQPGRLQKNLAVARRHVEKIGSIPALSQVYETAAWGERNHNRLPQPWPW